MPEETFFHTIPLKELQNKEYWKNNLMFEKNDAFRIEYKQKNKFISLLFLWL